MPQTGTTAKFPTTQVADADVGGPLDNFATLVLSGAHSATTLAIVVTTAIPAGWPAANGFITIDKEIIQYASFAGSTFTIADLAHRGMQNTVAAIHADQAVVGRFLTEQQQNQIFAEIKALEKAMIKDASINATGAMAIDWSAAGGLFKHWTTTGNVTGITLTNGQLGQVHTIEIQYGGAHTIAFTTTIKWANGITPTFTSVNGKKDVVTLIWDGTDWLGEFSGNH